MFFGIPVIRLAAVVVIATDPKEVAPVGAANPTLRVTPVGIVVFIFPVIDLTTVVVEMLYVVDVFVALFGC